MTAVRSGLLLAILLALSDVPSAFITDGEHPPVFVAGVTTALGVVTLVGAALAWRGIRAGFTVTAVTRGLSALSALPALVVDDVPAVMRVFTVVIIALTAVSLALMRVGARHPATMPTPSASAEVS